MLVEIMKFIAFVTASVHSILYVIKSCKTYVFQGR